MAAACQWIDRREGVLVRVRQRRELCHGWLPMRHNRLARDEVRPYVAADRSVDGYRFLDPAIEDSDIGLQRGTLLYGHLKQARHRLSFRDHDYAARFTVEP